MTQPPVHRMKADLDGDGTVGVADQMKVLAEWGSPVADINGDGVTDVRDLLEVQGNWGQSNYAGPAARFLQDVFEPKPWDDANATGRTFNNRVIPPHGKRYTGCNFIIAENADGVFYDGYTTDTEFIDCAFIGDRGSHAIDSSRGIGRACFVRPYARGVRYGNFIGGNSHDVEIIEPDVGEIYSEHALRIHDVDRMNVIGGFARRGPKTAITIRRGARNVSVVNTHCTGQVSIGPDQRPGLPQSASSIGITIAACTIDTGGSNTDRPIVVYPYAEVTLAGLDFIDPENELKGRRPVRIMPAYDGRGPGRVKLIGPFRYNGEWVDPADVVDTPSAELVEVVA